MKKYLFLFAASIMILSCLLGKTLVTASGEERESGYDRYYTNIEIRPGDSLWSIAERYRANSGMEVRQYISELKEINGLVSDSIEAGAGIRHSGFCGGCILCQTARYDPVGAVVLRICRRIANY